MVWFNGRINPAVAACIVADLEAVADADAERHVREKGLIKAFASAVPEGTEPVTTLDTPRVQRAWTRALLMLAMADGEFAEEEYTLIRSLAQTRGVPLELVDELAGSVVRRFQGQLNVDLPFETALDGVATSLDPAHETEEVDLGWN